VNLAFRLWQDLMRSGEITSSAGGERSAHSPLETFESVLPEDREFLLSRFDIIGEVGRGAMGVVYEAIHRGLESRVALKILHHGKSIQRFQREARLLARVRSPHVVMVHDFTTLPTGPGVLVMEWVEGMDLGVVMTHLARPMSEQEAIPILRGTCLGMIAVEEARIVHRDLKPSNILIDRRGLARVVDFGLARPGLDMPDAGLTLSGTFMGTPLYVAPEQAEDPQAADTRSDIYSFGASFYHVLTGAPPFTATSTLGIMMKHKTEPLVSPRALNTELSAGTCDVIERCLAKDPNDRFQSFREILGYFPDELDEFSPGVSVSEPEVAEILSRYYDRRHEYLKEWPAPGKLDTYRFRNGRVLSIRAGDIATLSADAIVSGDNDRLTMGDGVAEAILRLGGSQVIEEAAVFVPVRPGRVVVTAGGNLNARFVFHGVVRGVQNDKFLEPSRSLVLSVLRSSFYHAETLNLTSIAFPLLGTVSGEFPSRAGVMRHMRGRWAGYDEHVPLDVSEISRSVCLDDTFLFLAQVLSRDATPVREAAIVLWTPHTAP
jgi:eukaryotic-like serine/threonine-protein kinase